MILNEIRVALAGHIQRGNPCGYMIVLWQHALGIWGKSSLNKDFGKLVVFDKRNQSNSFVKQQVN
ncbi:MAG: hypothetical protein ACLR43_04825 [Faecalibacillus faecis]